MAGSTTKNTVNNRTHTDELREISSTHGSSIQRPEERRRLLIYYRIIRDRMIRFGEDFEVAAHRVNFNILF
ncbi:hypothetical protein GCK72_019427 [Caenorhabditis remanei]|nr:hypothetical protein GCK72_019427 [Caenorhabditis remanei]KAF1752872.1 hypothetical protein GCK72_019427 [Caenorhabditis remanei]